MTTNQQPQIMGSMLDEFYDLRERKRAIEAELQETKEQMEALENQILLIMDSQGVTATRGTRASVSISEVEVPTIEDWDAVVDYIKRNDAMHLLERRVSNAGWRELHESGETIPGTVPFKRRKLSLRKVG